MRRRVSVMRWLCAAVLMVSVITPARSADPLTLIILRLLRDKLITAGIESAVGQASRDRQLAAVAPPVAPQASLPYGMDARQLRHLIDEGFVHLSPAQRDEVHAAVSAILADPKNAIQAPAIISELAIKASAVRQAHERLNSLSSAQKRLIALEAREEYERMPAEERVQMTAILQARIVPLPVDLGEMILTEFARVQPVAVATRPAADNAGAAAPRNEVNEANRATVAADQQQTSAASAPPAVATTVADNK